MSGARRRTAARVFQDALQRGYDRHGPRGLILFGYLTVAPVLAVTDFLLCLMIARYAEVAMRDAWQLSLFHTGVIVVALLLGRLASRDALRVWLSWSGDGRSSARAEEVWNKGTRAARTLVVRSAIIVYVAAAAVGLPAIYAGWDLPADAFLPQLLWLVVVIATGAVATLFFLELLLRPGLRDVATFLPVGFVPRESVFSLRAKAILPIPGIVLFSGAIAGSFVDSTQEYREQVLSTFLVSMALAVVAVALYYVLAHAMLDPIDDLTEATRRVSAGDLETRVPVVSGDEVGVLAVSFNQMLDGLQERERLREHNVELAGALEESLSDVRASRARIVEAADDERRRMERDLHDGAQQRLVMISLKLAMATEMLSKDPAGAAALHEELRADAARAVDELRDLAHGIYPALLESDGLTAALEDVADQSALPVTVEGDAAGRCAAPVEAAVYFCCLEALQNAGKYAGPDCHVTIHLDQADGVLRFAVADDGRGFDPASLNGTVGLQNMSDRVGALGGTLTVTSSPGQGTTVTGNVPV